VADAANDGLSYPATFQDFMGVVSRWERARHYTSVRPGTGLGDALQQAAHELDDALAIFRQVWAHAEAGRPISASTSVPPQTPGSRHE